MRPLSCSSCRGGKRHLVVYLGEICKQDGVDHLIRALKLLRDEFRRDDIHCVLVGGGPYQPSIKLCRGGRRGRAVHVHRSGE